MNAVVYRADVNEAQADGALAALLGPATQRDPFSRLTWFTLLAQECLAPAHCFLAAAHDGAHTAALPLMQQKPGEVQGLSNWYSFSLRPVVSARDQAPGLLAAIARDLARTCGRVTLSPVPDEDVQLLRTAFRRAGWIAFAEPCDVNHVLRVDGRSFAEYWATRPGRLRETVRRKGRKGAVSLRITSAFSEADWAAYEAVYRLSWKPEEGSPAFLRRLAEAEAALGHLRLGIAEVDGRPVAAQFWTVEGGTAFIHKLAHDDSARAHSPGTLLSHALFEHAIDRDGVAEVDFGTGDDPYKRDWMDTVRTRWRLTFHRPGAVRQWPAMARALARRALHGSPLVSGHGAG